jgi:hypothetical protein
VRARARSPWHTKHTLRARTYTHKDLDGIRQIEKVRIPLHRIPRGRLQFYHVGVYHVGEGHFRCGCMDSTKFGFSAHTHTHTHTHTRTRAHPQEHQVTRKKQAYAHRLTRRHACLKSACSATARQPAWLLPEWSCPQRYTTPCGAAVRR